MHRLGDNLRFLAATDLSPRSDRAVERAVQLAGARKAHLTVLHVVSDELPRSILRSAVAEAEQVLQPRVAAWRESGVAVEHVVAKGTTTTRSLLGQKRRMPRSSSWARTARRCCASTGSRRPSTRLCATEIDPSSSCTRNRCVPMTTSWLLSISPRRRARPSNSRCCCFAALASPSSMPTRCRSRPSSPILGWPGSLPNGTRET